MGKGVLGQVALWKVVESGNLHIIRTPMFERHMTTKESIQSIDYCRHIRMRDRYDERMDGSIDI